MKLGNKATDSSISKKIWWISKAVKENFPNFCGALKMSMNLNNQYLEIFSEKFLPTDKKIWSKNTGKIELILEF